ncbi:formylmethanofuran dehydrogenase subunit B [Planctomicrobium sp. SH668]|uniref:formylmethanofuran dehydrogenase subunit B n=1 Tax=Planctomicrobium sp. SH668 TaxID=3448126 RepID=UPI003F5B4983
MVIFREVACSLCGCVCDDLQLQVEKNQIVSSQHACPLATSTYQKLNAFLPPVAEIGSEEASLEAAVFEAAEILKKSRAPVIAGLQGMTTEIHRAAIRLAEQTRGVIDTSGSPLLTASTLAFQQVGMSTCTLGEVKQRADLVIYWGADPVVAFPRHLERYTADPVSEFLPEGRANRTLYLINDAATETERMVDVSLRLDRSLNHSSVAALRMLVRDERWEPEGESSLPMNDLRQLAARMKGCRYGVVFVGNDFATDATSQVAFESLYRLVTELNGFSRFTVRPMGNPGAENVVTWQTGFPFAVSFQQGFPEYLPGEFSAESLLSRGIADCCVIVGTGALEHLSEASVEHLGKIPTIRLDLLHQCVAMGSSVRIRVCVPGVHTSGTIYRMDDVAIPLKKVCDSPYPAAEEVLNALSAQLGQ